MVAQSPAVLRSGLTACLAVGTALFVSLYPVEATFEVSANTERASVITGATRQRVRVVGVTLRELCEGGAGAETPFNGSIDLPPATTTQFRRAGSSAFILHVQPPAGGDRQIVMWRDDESLFRSTTCDLNVRLSTGQSNPVGDTVVISGEISVGGGATGSAGQGEPLLLAGEVTTYGHAIVGTTRYSATETKLVLGDNFTVLPRAALGVAFIRQATEGMKVVARMPGTEGVVERRSSAGYTVSIPIATRIQNDPLVASVWAVAAMVTGWFAWVFSRSRGDHSDDPAIRNRLASVSGPRRKCLRRIRKSR